MSDLPAKSITRTEYAKMNPDTPSSKTYTLAGSRSWQRTQRSKQVSQFTRRERNFINDALTSEWKQDLTGTRVIYVEPEGSDHLSMISKEGQEDGANANEGSQQARTQRKGRLKMIAKRLYPAKVVGGAKAVGGAIRHPMVTSRKMTNFIRRKGINTASTETSQRVDIEGTEETASDDLPPLTRSATMTELCPDHQQASPSKLHRRGILRRRNSAPISFGAEVSASLETNDETKTVGDDSPTVKISHVQSEDNDKDSQHPDTPTCIRFSSIEPMSSPHHPGASIVVVEDDDHTVASDVGSDRSPGRTKILNDIEEQVRSWTIESEGSAETGSTAPSSYASLLRHQRQNSHETVKGQRNGRQFSEPELSYLDFVLDALYNLIVDSALDKSGVQYRNTFAWKFHTENLNEFDRTIGHRFSSGGKRFRIKDFVNEFDFRGALLERLSKEPYHRELGLRWSEISFVDRRIKIELSYTLSDEESD